MFELAVGGTAVAGLKAPKGSSRDMAAALAELTGKPYITASNKFAALGRWTDGARSRRTPRFGGRIDRQRHAWLASGRAADWES